MPVSLKALARRSFYWGTRWLGIETLCRRTHRRDIMILYYHGVCDDAFAQAGWITGMHTPRSLFRRHLEYIQRSGWRFVSLTEAVQRLESAEPIPLGMVTITFDDGYANIARNAYPIMRQLGAKGCLYVVSDCVRDGQVVWTDWVESLLRSVPERELELAVGQTVVRLDLADPRQREQSVYRLVAALRSVDDAVRRLCLEKWSRQFSVRPHPEMHLATWDELRAMDPAVMEIGSHTCSHPNLDRVSSGPVLDREIGTSRADIAAAIGRDVAHFCYPGGAFNEAVAARVRQAGYASATSTRYGFNRHGADRLRLRRVNTGETFACFRAATSGVFGLYLTMSRALSRRSAAAGRAYA